MIHTTVTQSEKDVNAYYIPSLAKEYTLKPYTRSIARVYNETLLRGVIVRGDGSTDTPAINGDKAQEEMVRLLFRLSIQEMDAIDESDYQALANIVNERSKQKKSETASTSET